MSKVSDHLSDPKPEIKPTMDHLSDPYVLQLIEVLSKGQDEIERLTEYAKVSDSESVLAEERIAKLEATIQRVEELKPFFTRGNMGSEWVSVDLLRTALEASE